MVAMFTAGYLMVVDAIFTSEKEVELIHKTQEFCESKGGVLLQNKNTHNYDGHIRCSFSEDPDLWDSKVTIYKGWDSR